MNVDEAVMKFRDFLDKKLIDPIQNRVGRFVYDDDARIELDKSAYPKCLLQKMGRTGVRERRAIGFVGNTIIFPVRLIIKAKVGEVYSYGEEGLTAMQLITLMGEEAVKLVEENQNVLVEECFDSVLAIQDEYLEDNNKNPSYAITFELRFANT